MPLRCICKRFTHTSVSARGSFPVAERLGDQLLGLPLYPGLTPEQVDEVAGAVLDALMAPALTRMGFGPAGSLAPQRVFHGNRNMHCHIDHVEAIQLAPGVTKRVLLRAEQSATGGLEVTHHTLTGGQVALEGDGVEHQHYIVAGCALMRNRFHHSDTALFVPGCSRFGERPQHTLAHTGETELRIVTAIYRTPHPNFRWAKTRSKNLYQSGAVNLGLINNQQLFTEEEHALMGALRMHAIDVQTHAPLMAYPEHRNPEEIIYVLRGTGEILSGANDIASALVRWSTRKKGTSTEFSTRAIRCRCSISCSSSSSTM